jgi:hypothetical protein
MYAHTTRTQPGVHNAHTRSQLFCLYMYMYANVTPKTRTHARYDYFGFDHINRNAPVLIRTPKLTRFEPAQYWGGGPPGNSVVLNPFFFVFCSVFYASVFFCCCWQNKEKSQQMYVPVGKKSDTFSICACHPCAGAMLIFSVSFQFYRMRQFLHCSR